MWQGVCAAVVMAVLCVGAKHYGNRRSANRSTQRRQARVCADRERERRRQAHYMRNFWNYDGSEQEEFEG